MTPTMSKLVNEYSELKLASYWSIKDSVQELSNFLRSDRLTLNASDDDIERYLLYVADREGADDAEIERKVLSDFFQWLRNKRARNNMSSDNNDQIAHDQIAQDIFSLAMHATRLAISVYELITDEVDPEAAIDSMTYNANELRELSDVIGAAEYLTYERPADMDEVMRELQRMANERIAKNGKEDADS